MSPELIITFFAHLFADSFIQKTKQRYNNTRTLTSRLNLSEMSEDLQNNPPFQILQTELGPENNTDVKTYKTGGEGLYIEFVMNFAKIMNQLGANYPRDGNVGEEVGTLFFSMTIIHT